MFKDMGIPVIDGVTKTYSCGCELTLALLTIQAGAFMISPCPFHTSQLVLELKALESNDSVNEEPDGNTQDS